MATPQVKVWKVKGYANTPLPLASHEQILDPVTFNDRDLQQSDLTGISYTVTQGSAVVAGPAVLTGSACVFNTLQTGSAWTADDAGFNFLFTLPGSALPLPGETYRVGVTFTLSGGNTFPTFWDVTTVA